MADGNSVGVLNDEDTASRLSEGVSSLIPAESASTTTSKAGKRPMKLRNKVYFQLLEATNALQREEAEKTDGGAKPVKLSSAQVARLAQIALETQPQDEKAVEASRAQLSEFVPLRWWGDAWSLGLYSISRRFSPFYVKRCGVFVEQTG